LFANQYHFYIQHGYTYKAMVQYFYLVIKRFWLQADESRTSNNYYESADAD